MRGALTYHRVLATAAAALTLGIAAALPSPASALPGFATGFGDVVYRSSNAAARERWYAESERLGASLVRIDVIWRRVASERPALPQSPLDPAYDFSALDAAVRGAAAHGLEVMLTVYSAPRWAEAPNRPGVPTGTWKPDPEAFGDFGEALARRYSGSFPDDEGAVLPRVGYLEAWNEPNLAYFLNPQWEGRSPAGARHYRRMVNAFRTGVNAGNPAAKVVAGATAPYGDGPGEGDRTRPLRFLRELLCIEGRGAKRLKPARCAEPTRLDVLSHHPLNLFEGPAYSARHPDDATTADFGKVARLLRFAERKGTIQSKGKPDAWATEIWWESQPPRDRDDRMDVPLRTHAHWVEEATASLWKQGARAVLWLQIVDSPLRIAGMCPTLQTGVYFNDGRPKPAARAFAFPFVVERSGKRSGRAWTLPPRSGRLAIQRDAGKGWRTVKKVKVDAGRPKRTRIPLRGGRRFRAKLGGEKTLTWPLAGSGDGQSRDNRKVVCTNAAARASSAGGAPTDLTPGSRLESLLEAGP